MPGLLYKWEQRERGQFRLWRPKDELILLFAIQSLGEAGFPVSDELSLLINIIFADSEVQSW